METPHAHLQPLQTASSRQRIVIAGGSGFVGRSLAIALTARGDEVVILSRDRSSNTFPWRTVNWDGRTVGSWVEELEGATALINLAGRSVDCVKSPENIDAILRSRIDSTRVLGQALRLVKTPPPVWVQMSTAHIYGDSLDVTCTEQSPLGYGLAPFVGQAWEAALQESLLPEQRGVILRTSFVLGKNQGAGMGALKRLHGLTRLGMGGRIGSGRQGISWIHEHDLNTLFIHALTNSKMHGAYVASAPRPVSQVEFMRALRRALGVPIGLPSPAWLVALGARWILRTDPELALYGRYVVSQRLAQLPFKFQFEKIESALGHIFTQSGSTAFAA
ncbi:epimerase [Planctomicrobium piriforme]|uniref:Epimerase family protein n=1 Tax=Planctomicrobium piriforme TaxID=1576369 RepID=A0A1I3D7P6_9PLAN|nr:DUF1731 domain-containing protein [Planctomicrobium piriforme]SFH82696.1 hypothetical protein SAMN05421753_103124 [Planctomicrobium piriforme]